MTTENPPESQGANPPITSESVQTAAQLIGLSFTEAERELMLPMMERRRREYDSLRGANLPNAAHPAFRFDPRVTRAQPVAPLRKYPELRDETELPANLEDVAFFPVTKLAWLLRTRQLSSVRLTEIYLERLKRYGPKLECVITLTEDRAIEQARRADAEIASGIYRSPLHGIPWGAKDLIAVRGYPTTWGAAPYQEQQFDADAAVVQRLDEAGAVLVAKLSTGELAHGDQWFGGKTRNPWNLSEGSGGSSAGPASATAAGLVGFALGTETTGSVIWPALRCGVTGLRPTFGRVSRAGVMMLSWTLDKVGPLARSAEDCALILTAIYGVDEHEPFSLDEPFEWTGEVSGLRVGYVPGTFAGASQNATVEMLRALGVDPREHRGNDNETLAVLRSLGFQLVPIEMPRFDADALLITLAVEGAAAFDQLRRTNQDDQLVNQSAMSVANRNRQARLIPAVEYLQASRIRAQLMQAMAEVMRSVDVIVIPQLAENNSVLTNLTGQPAIGVPNGFTEDGMPTGINFVGAVCGEAALLSAAHAYQAATAHHLRHPQLE